MRKEESLEKVTTTHLDTRVGLKLFNEIMKKWGVTSSDARILLGDIPRSTYNDWLKQDQPKLPHDTIARISYIIGIVKGLRIIFGNTHRADEWVNKPNKKLNGKSALEVMLHGEVVDLSLVRGIVVTARGM